MEKQIQRWLEQGIITKDVALKLLADVKLQQQKMYKLKINVTIYTIAAILIGLGVITFISANDWLLKLFELVESLKIIVLFSLTAFSLWGGYKLEYEVKKYPKLGYFLTTLSTLLIGGTYALIGQTYNINANNSSFTFLWMLSILPVAYIFKNYAVNILSIILFILSVIFFFAELKLDVINAWSVYIPLLLGTLLYTTGNIPIILNKYNKFSLSYKIVGLIPIFITLLVLTCSVNTTYHILSPYYILPIFILMGLNLLNYQFNKEKKDELLLVETIFVFSILFFMLCLLLAKTTIIPLVVLLANVAIIAIIAFGFNYGYKYENLKIIGLTNWFLVIYLIVNYFRWAWSFMDKSLFFILGGVALLYLGIYLEKKRTFVKNKNKGN
ncbi:DUF2157 domain-containing protein [bacterium]|nr:DUF2157 domain-containing protein [bacterium]